MSKEDNWIKMKNEKHMGRGKGVGGGLVDGAQ